MWHIFEQCPTAKNLNIAQGKQYEYEKNLQKNLAKYEGKLTSGMKSNPKRFFRYLNSKRKVKNNICPLKRESGGFTENAEETANTLGSFFASTFTSEEGDMPNVDTQNYGTSDDIPDLIINEGDVKNLLETVNINKSMGPDSIHPKLLKFLSSDSSFVSAITDIFRKCYDAGALQ